MQLLQHGDQLSWLRHALLHVMKFCNVEVLALIVVIHPVSNRTRDIAWNDCSQGTLSMEFTKDHFVSDVPLHNLTTYRSASSMESDDVHILATFIK